MMTPRNRNTLSLFATMAATAFFTLPVQSQEVLFSEDFNSHFSQNWNTTVMALPDQSLAPFRQHAVGDRGAPSAEFVVVDGSDVLKMNTTNAESWARHGYLSEAAVNAPSFQLEARINTLDQGGKNSDGLFDLWLVNSRDSSKFVNIGMFGDQFDTLRSWYYTTSLTPFSVTASGNLPSFAYDSNTWYRLRITQAAGSDLEVSIWNDAGNKELVSHVFDYGLDAIGPDFNVGFSQWMGGPQFTQSLLSAVDYIHVTSLSTPVPAPSFSTMMPVILVVSTLLFRQRKVGSDKDKNK